MVCVFSSGMAGLCVVYIRMWVVYIRMWYAHTQHEQSPSSHERTPPYTQFVRQMSCMRPVHIDTETHLRHTRIFIRALCCDVLCCVVHMQVEW